MPQFHKAMISAEPRIKTQKHSNTMKLSDEHDSDDNHVLCPLASAPAVGHSWHSLDISTVPGYQKYVCLRG
jgi:hypothetical protein